MDKKVTKPLNIDRLQRDLEHLNVERDIHNILRKNKYKIDSNTKNTNSNRQKDSPENRNNVYKLSSEENKKKNQLLQELDYLRNNYIKNFVEDSKKKTDAEAKKSIPLEGENFKKKVD